MALFTPSASPAVTVKEIDLTGVVPNVQTSTGAFVGNFGWGPVGVATLVSDESGLVSTFSAPTDDNTVDFHSAAYFLRYSNSCFIVREQDSDGKNSVANNTSLGSLTAQTVNNLDAFEDLSIDSSDGAFIAKYPGTIGNSLKISIVGTDSASGSETNFNSWAYKDNFDGATGTSAFVTALGGSNDEIHVAVIDEDGEITGNAGTVLETFPYLSVAKNAKSPDGSSNYFKEVLKLKSKWVYAGDFHRSGDSDGVNDFAGALWGSTATTAGQDFKTTQNYSNTTSAWSFKSGNTSASLGTDDFLRGYDKFEDKDNIEVDFLIAPESLSNTAATTIVNDLVAIAGTTRKDCVAVASPSRNAVVTVGTNVGVLANNNTYTKSSYLVQDNNYLKVFDKYNDKYIKIPAASSTAGLMAATDLVAAPWFSPAGSRRGRYQGITDIILSPTKAERDALYKAGINPIANIPGEGIMLFGDKTNESRPSAFDRINVRRLFLGIERAIAIAGRNVMFEFNDEFTRAEFVNIVEPFLREIQGRRGITDFRVVCDATNNTAAVVDRNEFIASIFIKPARSINFVTLNFVAVRTGVEFDEVVGTV
jgi:phage tail sheath protein FI|tara:strand:- start:1943 stop:3715 length:1773 start_codon:yes stop_codon:yes gene_type:complete